MLNKNKNKNKQDGATGTCLVSYYHSAHRAVDHETKPTSERLAEFKIETAADSGITSIAVFHPGDSIPFFKADVKPIPILSSIPLPYNSNLLTVGTSGVIQPPIPAGRNPEEVATTQWAQMPMKMTGMVRLVSVVPQLDGKLGDGVGHPAVVPWSIGGYVGAFNLDCPIATFSDKME